MRSRRAHRCDGAHHTAFSACLPQPNNYYLSDETVPILNICFAAVLLPALLACFGLFWWRVYR